MARKRTPPKPIFPIKHEFVDALDNYIQKSMQLGSTVGQVLKYPETETFRLSENIRKMLGEQHDAWRAAFSQDDQDEG